jgi:DNA-binding CsgD family transcriptional regulator
MRYVLLYGAAAGLLIAALQFMNYRFLVVEHSFEVYGLLLAGIFATVGLWLGRTLTREKIVVREVPVEVEVAVPAPAGVFLRDQAKVDALALTPRELEVLELVAAGLSNKEMAERLFVSENTVKTHCSRVFDKLGVGRRTQAVQAARTLRLIP